MYYINPENIVKNHAKENEIPKWDIAILCFHSVEKTLDIVNYFCGKKMGYRLFSKCDCNMVFETIINNQKIGILGWCTGGGPLVASLIEEISVTGVKWIVGIGAVASIDNAIKRNEVIFPTDVYVNDGVSKCYCDSKWIKIDKEMYSIICQVMLSDEYLEVKGATVEALYRQCEEMLEPWRMQGVQVVNWELGPFYAVSHVHQIKAAWIGHVSDVETKEVWQSWYFDRKNVFEDVLKICKKIVMKITEVKGCENKF